MVRVGMRRELSAGVRRVARRSRSKRPGLAGNTEINEMNRYQVYSLLTGVKNLDRPL